MTVIAAAVSKEGRIVMGADSACVCDDGIRPNAQPKIWRGDGFLMGASGSHRVCQIARHVFTPPEHAEGVDAISYMVKEFAEKLRAVVKECGAEVADDENGVTMNAACLIAYHGLLFEIDSGYGVLVPATHYYAIGCAAQVAMGAMYAARHLEPEVMVKTALEASAEFDEKIRRPFTIESLEK